MRLVPALLLLAATANAATPVYKGSFDSAEQNWTVARGSAVLDSTVLHDGHKSIRLERDANSPDASVRLAPITLTIGKRYELSGWIHTEDLEVQDLDRSPIAMGATMTMASMPWDVHSAALGGTQPWTRVSLSFVASRSRTRFC